MYSMREQQSKNCVTVGATTYPEQMVLVAGLVGYKKTLTLTSNHAFAGLYVSQSN